MSPEFRRHLVLIIVAAAGTFVALTVTTWLRQDACVDAGGRWEAASRACAVPAGSPAPTSGLHYVLGGLAGLVAAFVLWRTFTFFARRGARGAA